MRPLEPPPPFQDRRESFRAKVVEKPRLQSTSMLSSLRTMPGGIRLFLVYSILILAGIGLAMPAVVETAVNVPISFTGVVVMILLAYTIFTTTLVLQRKEAARGLALGLASLTLPAIPLLLLSGLVLPAVFMAALAVLLFRGLLQPEARGYLSEP